MKSSNTQTHRIVRFALVTACAAFAFGPSASIAGAQDAVVGNLRLASDDTGTPMETVPAGPGEKVYALETGDNAVNMAFDFSGTAPTTAQIRLMGPMGVSVHQEDVELVQPGPYVVTYEPGDLPLAETEYVVNVYVEAEGSYYLADSLQMTVGNATLSPAVNEAPAVGEVPVEAPAVPELINEVGSPQGADTPADVPGPSTMLLMLAGVGVLGLLAVVAWAGMSAMKAG